MENLDNFLFHNIVDKKELSQDFLTMIHNNEGYRIDKPQYENFESIMDFEYNELNNEDIFRTIFKLYRPKIDLEILFDDIINIDNLECKTFDMKKDYMISVINNFVLLLFRNQIRKDNTILTTVPTIPLYAIWLCKSPKDVYDTYCSTHYTEEEMKNFTFYKYEFEKNKKYFLASDLGNEGFLVVSNKPFELKEIKFPYTK